MKCALQHMQDMLNLAVYLEGCELVAQTLLVTNPDTVHCMHHALSFHKIFSFLKMAAIDPTTSSEERHVAIILSKHVTWNSKFYQVTTMCIYIVHFRYISSHNIHILSTKVVWLGRPLTESTWEPETSLPQELVADYEAGFLQEVQRETFTTGGQTIRTLSTAPTKDVCKESRAKRPKIDSPDTLCDSSG